MNHWRRRDYLLLMPLTIFPDRRLTPEEWQQLAAQFYTPLRIDMSAPMPKYLRL